MFLADSIAAESVNAIFTERLSFGDWERTQRYEDISIKRVQSSIEQVSREERTQLGPSARDFPPWIRSKKHNLNEVKQLSIDEVSRAKNCQVC